MKLFRQPYLRKAMIIFTGITFLNMSFFLAEVEALKLDENKKLLENIVRLISGAGFEEERDTGGSNSSEGDVPVKEVDLHAHHIFHHHTALVLIAQKRNRISDCLLFHAGYGDTFSPPPEA